MAGLVPAIHVFSEDVDARHKAGHEELLALADLPERGGKRLGVGHDGVAGKVRRLAGVLRRIAIETRPSIPG